MQLSRGTVYITTYGAMLTVNSVTLGAEGKVRYSSCHVDTPHLKTDTILPLRSFEELIRSRAIILDTPANRILYCPF